MINLSDPSSLEPEVKKLVQQQLVLLIHSHACLKKDQQNAGSVSTGQAPRHPSCHLEHCDTFKELMKHMYGCREGANCTTQYCSSSRKIMRHWKECKDFGCPVCAPIRSVQT